MSQLSPHLSDSGIDDLSLGHHTTNKNKTESVAPVSVMDEESDSRSHSE